MMALIGIQGKVRFLTAFASVALSLYVSTGRNVGKKWGPYTLSHLTGKPKNTSFYYNTRFLQYKVLGTHMLEVRALTHQNQ